MSRALKENCGRFDYGTQLQLCILITWIALKISCIFKRKCPISVFFQCLMMSLTQLTIPYRKRKTECFQENFRICEFFLSKKGNFWKQFLTGNKIDVYFGQTWIIIFTLPSRKSKRVTVIWWFKPKVCHFNGICLIFPLLRDLCSFPCTLISFSYFFIVTNWFFLSSISSRRYFHTVQEDTQSIMKWPYHKNAAYLCWGFLIRVRPISANSFQVPVKF